MCPMPELVYSIQEVIARFMPDQNIGNPLSSYLFAWLGCSVMRSSTTSMTTLDGAVVRRCFLDFQILHRRHSDDERKG